ncbi:unnamed protein product [Amoebophrya sp. A25]|nr:unnamed protein product [Amoebophrya sp. A25]|eukprot:GSA25T00008506001.1
MLSTLRNLASHGRTRMATPIRTFFFVISLSLMEMVEAKQTFLRKSSDSPGDVNSSKQTATPSALARPAHAPYLRGASSFTQVLSQEEADKSEEKTDGYCDKMQLAELVTLCNGATNIKHQMQTRTEPNRLDRDVFRVEQKMVPKCELVYAKMTPAELERGVFVASECVEPGHAYSWTKDKDPKQWDFDKKKAQSNACCLVSDGKYKETDAATPEENMRSWVLRITMLVLLVILLVILLVMIVLKVRRIGAMP